MFKILLILFSSAVFAQNDNNNNHQITFQTEKVQKVVNDVMLVNMKIEAIYQQMHYVNSIINKKTKQVKDILQSFNIEFKTTNYNIHPQYEEKKIKNWKGAYNFSIESKDFETLTKALKKIQNIANYQSLRFFVSTEKTTKVYNQLLLKAINQHKNQAVNIARGFGAEGYRLIQTNFNQAKTYPQPQARMSLMADSIAPSFSTGKSDVRIKINSTIELQ